MKTCRSIVFTVFAVTLPGMAAGQPGPDTEGYPWAASPMPRMMMDEGSMPRGPMMNPRMREMMMQHRQRMSDGEFDPDMHRRHHMMMQSMIERRGQMMQGPGGAKEGMPGMRHRMMQEMRGEKMEHMRNMERRLENIEALLGELLEQGKSGAE